MVIAVVILSIFLCVSIVYLIRFSMILINIEDVLDESLLILDNSYIKMSEVMKLPVAIVTDEVRQVLDEIDNSREAILMVAARLGTISDTDVVEEPEEEKLSDEEKEKLGLPPLGFIR